jgi:hypothetical protein
MYWLRWPGFVDWPQPPTPTLPGTGLFSTPAAVSWNDEGRLDVFAISSGDSGGTLVHWWLDLPINQATWASEVLHGRNLVFQPCVTSWGSERLDVFAMDERGSLWHWKFDQTKGVNFGQPEQIQGSVSTPPCAVSWGPNRIDLFAGANSGVLHWVYDATNSAAIVDFVPDQNPLAQSVGAGYGPPSAVSWGAGAYDVFAVDAQGEAGHWYFSQGNTPVPQFDGSMTEASPFPLASPIVAATSEQGLIEAAAICIETQAPIDGEQLVPVYQVVYFLFEQ